MIISAVDAGYYQHPRYQRESIAGLQPFFGRLFGFVHPFRSAPGRMVCNETAVCGFTDVGVTAVNRNEGGQLVAVLN